MDWSKAQQAASARLAEELRKGLEQLNVRIAAGTGSLLGEHRVRITNSLGNHEDIEAEYIILATGSRPDYSAEQGSRFYNSDDLIARSYTPSHLFIIGGGYVGCEFASIYRALGCRVTLAEQRERLIPRLGFDRRRTCRYGVIGKWRRVISRAQGGGREGANRRWLSNHHATGRRKNFSGYGFGGNWPASKCGIDRPRGSGYRD